MDKKSFVSIQICNLSSTLDELYTLMLSIRLFELSLLEMFDKGMLSGTTHTCLGQEISAVGIISPLDRSKDIIFSNHRGHGHFLSYCGEIERLYLEIMGKPDGVCAGRGGSQHLHYKNFYSNGVQGGIVPVATGMALAEKIKSSQAVTVVFLGDGTLGEGVVYESFNIASLWKLPILFVIDNNEYAQTTPRHLHAAGVLSKRPEAFGIPTKEISSTDVCVILKAASEEIGFIRSECLPRCLLLHSVRLGPHSKGDDYRTKQELDEAKNKDPLSILESKIDSSRKEKIRKEVSSKIEIVKNTATERLNYDTSRFEER